MRVILSRVIDDLNNKIDSLIIEGLKRKGYDVNHKFGLEEFIRTRCRCEQNDDFKERIYYVDNKPFLLHKYNTEVNTDLNCNDLGTSIEVSGGSFSYI